jgi:hypothetical protein
MLGRDTSQQRTNALQTVGYSVRGPSMQGSVHRHHLQIEDSGGSDLSHNWLRVSSRPERCHSIRNAYVHEICEEAREAGRSGGLIGEVPRTQRGCQFGEIERHPKWECLEFLVRRSKPAGVSAVQRL